MTAALLVAAACWYLGADFWHALLLGGVITLLGSLTALEFGFDQAAAGWHSGGPSGRRGGSRRDIAELSYSMRGTRRHVGVRAMMRVKLLARQRLAIYHLDLLDPGDRPQIEQLIGRRAYVVFSRGDRRPPPLGALLRSLDILDALDPTQPVVPRSSRRRMLPAITHRQRSTREQ